MSIEIKNRWTGTVIKTVDAANLYAANLRGANLYGADLMGTNLMGVDLYGADLRGADLSGADLSGANLYAANLYAANLRGANLMGANLCDAKRYIDGETTITLRGPRPILTVGPLGSRNDMMMALITSAGLRIECGCFCGTLDEFKAAVEKNHAENPRHRDEYLAVVRMIKTWAKVELKFADQWEKENPLPQQDGER